MNNDLNQATFSFFIADKKNERYANAYFLDSAQLWLGYTSNTTVLYEKNDEVEVAVIGLCVDSHGEYSRNEIPSLLLQDVFSDAFKAYRFCDRFAGKYCIYYSRSGKTYMWGDATCSLPIAYYYEKNAIAISNTEQMIALKYGFKESIEAMKIMKGSSSSQPLPNNITLFDEIQILLPNHILSFYDGNSYRIPISAVTADKSTIDRICANTLDLINNIIEQYRIYYNCIFPLTAGTDSRTIVSLFSKVEASIECFTYKHSNFDEKTPDIKIPRDICAEMNYSYYIIPDIHAPYEYTKKTRDILGSNFEDTVVDLAYTYNSVFKNRAFINGDIIDQIGKSLIGNNIPSFFATSRFFQCKLHNHYKGTRAELNKYLNEIRLNKEKKHVFDLFAVENRCCRWGTQSDSVLCLFGITSLNIFNCREVINEWIRIPRKKRVNLILHKYYIAKSNPKLLDYSFNPGDWTDVFKRNWILFYIATFIKHFIDR